MKIQLIYMKFNQYNTLVYKNEISTLGLTPRHFNIKDNILVVANQDSNDVVIFEIKKFNLIFLKKFTVNCPNYILLN